MEKIHVNDLSRTSIRKSAEAVVSRTDSQYSRDLFYSLDDYSLLTNQARDLGAIRKLDLEQNYKNEFMENFGDIVSDYEIDAGFLHKIYQLDMMTITVVFSFLKYKANLENYIVKLKHHNEDFNAEQLASSFNRIINLLKIQNDQSYSEIVCQLKLAVKPVFWLYQDFIVDKNTQTIMNISSILDALNKVKLPKNATFTPANINTQDLSLQKLDAVYYDGDSFDEKYDLEEPPYLKESRLLSLLSPIWEVKKISEFAGNMEKMGLGLELNQQIIEFQEISNKLKSYKELSKEFSKDIKLFLKIAINILQKIK